MFFNESETAETEGRPVCTDGVVLPSEPSEIEYINTIA